MGHYSLLNVFKQSPEKVKNTVLAVLGVAAGLRGWDPGLLETVGVGFAIERTLDLFYVAPFQNVQNEIRTLQGIELGKQLGPVVNAEDVSVEEGPQPDAEGDDAIRDTSDFERVPKKKR